MGGSLIHLRTQQDYTWPTYPDDTMSRTDWLAFALRLANAADALSLQAFRTESYSIKAKADRSTVTDVDRRIEALLREAIEAEFPTHGILGEEFGEAIGAPGDHLWLLDPIDGTENFVHRVPIFATIIALRSATQIEIAVVSAPALGRRWWATRGNGAFSDRGPLQTSRIDSLSRASLTHGSLRSSGSEDGKLLKLAGSVRRTRGFGNFWSHVLVAEGSFDLGYTGSGSRPWDTHPLALIVAESGGRLTNTLGEAWSDRDPVLSSNGFIHQAALEILNTTL